MALKEKVKEIIRDFSLSIYGINKFKLYLNQQSDKLKSFEIISENVFSDITKIYNKIKDIKKYEKQCSDYKKLLVRVKDHNNEVREISDFLDKINLENWFIDPYKVKESELEETYQTTLRLERYSKVDKKYLNIKNSIVNFYRDFNLIKLQFSASINLKTIINKYLALDRFLDKYYKNDLDSELKEIDNLIKNSEKLYYDFSEINNLGDKLKAHNNEYVERNVNESIFNDINGKTLDVEQRKAILNSEIANLVIAGAGSGKTLTICGKVKYLIEKEGVSSSDILLLSYSKKSALDLEKKIKLIDKKVSVFTFHKLGLDILKNVYNKPFLVEEQYDAIIEEYFRKKLVNRPKILDAIFMFLTLFFKSNFNDKKYKDIGEKYQELKTSNYTTIKDILFGLSNSDGKKETLKKELVKSDQELILANFYFINGINYEYEKPYKVDTSTSKKRQYTPDFYLVDYDIYHEHYGIDEKGRCPQYDSEEEKEYLDSMAWKRETHSTNNTKCIETYSYEFSNGEIFDNLKTRLKENNVEFKPIKIDTILEIMNSKYYGLNLKSFINLIKTFISLYKSQYEDESGFLKLKDEFKYFNSYQKIRCKLFLMIAKDVYSYYMNYIRKDNRIDFDDMILMAINALNNSNSFNYKYIIVDEFQDMSQSRLKFLLALIQKGRSRLFAVGDDWQAIYRFSGCDINIFLNFSQIFKFNTINFINTTYRNSQELQDIATKFIMANSEQYSKKIKSNKNLENPVKIVYYSNNKTMVFNQILEEIYKLNKEANILILGRNNHDKNSILNKDLVLLNNNNLYSNEYTSLNLKYSTVHSSKGLEEDYVILINSEDANLGFPNKIEDDAVLSLVLGSNGTYLYAEERRLWYVALTRTKTYTYILCDYNRPSIFIDEIKENCFEDKRYISIEEKTYKCPHCKSGNLVLHKTNNNIFYGCSNFPYCKYTLHDLKAVERNLRCARCHDYLVLRKGKFGMFYGCNSYPKCTYTEPIEEKIIKN